MTSEVFYYILRIPIVLLSLSVHEVAHGYAAYKFGDPTARNLGRLSLNPLKHLDPIGALCMLLFGFGWAKPVPINTRYFKNPKSGMALSALAGPLSNLIMAFVAFVTQMYILRFGATAIFTNPNGIVYMLFLFFNEFFYLNISLAVFNLLPIPPLDGSRILFYLLPDKVYFGVMKYEQYITIAMFAFLWLGWLDAPIYYIRDIFITAFSFITQFLPFL